MAAGISPLNGDQRRKVAMKEKQRDKKDWDQDERE
jgi:hypothetical protein